MWYFIFKVKELIIIFIPTNSLSLGEGGKWMSIAPVARRRQEVLSVFFLLPIAALLIGRLKVHEHRWLSIFLHTFFPPNQEPPSSPRTGLKSPLSSHRNGIDQSCFVNLWLWDMETMPVSLWVQWTKTCKSNLTLSQHYFFSEANFLTTSSCFAHCNTNIVVSQNTSRLA